MSLSNMSRVEDLLTDPKPDISLSELKADLNELAKLRQNTRLQFCKRLAIVYFLICGRRYSKEAPKDDATSKFLRWCEQNIRTYNGKRYASNTLRGYLFVGFSSNPEKALSKRQAESNHTNEVNRKLGSRIRQAIQTDCPPRPVPVATIRQKFEVNRDVASEVNALMRAWEQACPEARRIFIQHVT